MIRYFLPGLLGLLLSACVTPPAPVDEHSQQRWNQRLEQLAPLQDWQIRGRVVLFVDDEVYHLGLRWRRQGPSSHLKLEASLAQGLVQLRKSDAGVELNTSEGEHYSGNNAEQVIFQATGLTIPVEGLESWIKGIPHGGSAYRHQIDGQGRADNIVQDGWFINYLEYEAVPLVGLDKPDLPRRLYLKRERLAMKVVLDQWLDQALETTDPDLFPAFPR